MINDKNFANLFRQTPEMVCILSGPEHRFEFVNDAHITALGFDATGQTVRQAQPESVEVHGILDEVYRTGVTADLREIPVTLTDRVRYFNLTYAARRDAADEIDGIMILGSEVTNQVLARRSQDNQRRWLESVLNGLPSPVLFLDPKTGAITFQNDAAKQLLEYSTLPEYLVERVLGGQWLEDVEVEIQSPDELLTVEASSRLFPEEFSQSATILLVLRDSTAKKRIQRLLEYSEQQLTLALRTSAVGFYDWNVRDDVIVFSPQMRSDWGMPSEGERMTMGDAMQRLHRDDRARVSAVIERSMAHDEPYHVEYRVVHSDGKVVTVEVRGHVERDAVGAPQRFFGTSVDISARAEGERNVRALADSMPQIVWAARSDGVLDYTNQRWTEYSGSQDPEQWLEFVDPVDKSSVIETWTAAVSLGQAYDAEFGLRRQSDGTYRRHLVRADPSRDDAGKITRWFGTCTDIEDQKRIEDALREASASKTEFLANMSHEIRTPLGAILGFVELVRVPEIETEKFETYLSVIERNSRHLLRLVDDILDLSKVEAGQMLLENVELSLPGLLADLGSLVAMYARERGVEFQLRATTPLPTVLKSDPTRLRQILMNLAGNAVKFTEHGQVLVEIAHEAPLLRIRVTDTGVGISPQDQAKLFAAFSQGDASVTRRFGGTGLGLALTRRLCALLGGELTLLHSELGKGSVFEATLLVDVTAGTEFVTGDIFERVPASDPESEDSRSLYGVKILVVEDAPDNQTLLRILLSDAGAQVHLEIDGRGGVEAALRGDFDIVLMDIQMPRLDGHSAARQLRARGFGKPLVALTAHAMKGERERAFESGFDSFLPKPFTRELLIETVTASIRPTKPAVLIVEDNDDMREMVGELLQSVGFSGTGVRRAEEALEILEQAPRPLIVLMDISLPGMSGEEFLRVVNERPDRGSLRVVLTSGWADLADRARAHAADGFLRKPFQVKELLAELERVTRDV